MSQNEIFPESWWKNVGELEMLGKKSWDKKNQVKLQKKLGKIAKKIRWKNVGKREKLEKKCWEMWFEKHQFVT